MTDPARPGLWARLRACALHLKAELLALSLAARDPRTPWYARAWALLVLAYALSPIDLIPDFIPVLGQLDDLLLVPAGLWVALRLVPPGVLVDARRAAAAHPEKLARSALGATLIVLVYAALIVLAWAWWRARRG
ncbi:YkvA family protein [Deinococcus kurensis]|uniref:YkvA family protein n=1 Tax=Deinococcus kurensis TaxID=2662757 RepID=UPI0012D2FA34|nr:YkvA family protein [Deinococcus kurensis]